MYVLATGNEGVHAKYLKQNTPEPTGIKPIVHLLNTDYDMVVIALTLIGRKKLAYKYTSPQLVFFRAKTYF